MVAFRRGALQKQINDRGINQETFAKLAGLSDKTIWSACQGLPISKGSRSKIRAALTVVPTEKDAMGAAV
jgi:hypothetical protein